jgi:hypothetical protein
MVAASVAWIIHYTREAEHGRGIPDADYFTIDDGQTYFVDDFKKVPPFEVNGSVALRAAVFTCGDGTPFVGFVEKFNPEAKAQMEGVLKDYKPSLYDPPPFVFMGNMGLVKKRGESEWVPLINRTAADQITNVLCPDGTPAQRIRPKER